MFKKEKIVAIWLLIFAILFNAIFLWPEVSIPAPPFNDEVYHIAATKEAGVALRKGFNPVDFWFSTTELGYPLFRHYQHLPQVIIAFAHQLAPFLLSVERLFDIFRYVLLVTFPASVFVAMRRFGFPYLASGIAALVSPLISDGGLFGFDYRSYTWWGLGIYTQLWAMWVLPLAWAELYRAIVKRKPSGWAVLLLAAVLLLHLIYAAVAALSALLFVCVGLRREEIVSRAKRLALVFFFAGIAVSYFYLPLIFDAQYVNSSRWIPRWKYDSFGHWGVLQKLMQGELFDAGRFPSLTILFFAGAAALWTKRKKALHLVSLALVLMWLVLFFGRPTWGFLLDLLPHNNFFQFHRLIGALHLASVMVIGAGVYVAWEYVKKHPRNFAIAFVLILALLFVPVYVERIVFYKENGRARLETQKAFRGAESELLRIENTLKTLPPGRVFAGLPLTWGNGADYRIGNVPLYSLFPLWGVDSFGYSYHSEALTADVRLLFDDANPLQYDLFNIRYVVLHKTWNAPSYYSKIKEFERYDLYEVPTSGYFDFVDVPATLYGSPRDFYGANSRWLASSLPALKQHPIIVLGKKAPNEAAVPLGGVTEEILEGFSSGGQEAPQGKILKENVSFNRYEARFEVFQETYLMLKANYHPGFKAYLDGERVSPVMVAPGFIAIQVGPGLHEASFAYEISLWKTPLLTLGITLLFGAFLFPHISHIMKVEKSSNNARV